MHNMLIAVEVTTLLCLALAVSSGRVRPSAIAAAEALLHRLLITDGLAWVGSLCDMTAAVLRSALRKHAAEYAPYVLKAVLPGVRGTATSQKQIDQQVCLISSVAR